MDVWTLLVSCPHEIWTETERWFVIETHRVTELPFEQRSNHSRFDKKYNIMFQNQIWTLNPLTAGVAYIRVFIFYWHIKYNLLNMLKI